MTRKMVSQCSPRLLSLRYSVEQQMYLGVFADVGNTWSSLSAIDLGNLYRGVGFGLRSIFPCSVSWDLIWMGLDDPKGSSLDKNQVDLNFIFL